MILVGYCIAVCCFNRIGLVLSRVVVDEEEKRSVSFLVFKRFTMSTPLTTSTAVQQAKKTLRKQVTARLKALPPHQVAAECSFISFCSLSLEPSTK